MIVDSTCGSDKRGQSSRWAFIPILSGMLCGIAILGSPSVASADPANDPCGLAVTILCRFLLIAPDLDHDIDLTTEVPPTTGASVPEDPPVGLCADNCR